MVSMRLRPIHPSRLHRSLAVTALLFLLALQLLHVDRLYSPNWDESHHLYDGYRIWTLHDYRLNAEVPPLIKLAAAVPLLPMHLSTPPNRGKSETAEAFPDGRLFVFDNGGDRVLFPARMACMLFTLLLAWLIYAAGRRMFGTLAALIALALFVFDPNVLANGALVETDLGSACFIFAAIYAFYRYSQNPSPAKLTIAGLACGLAMVTKFTGIFVAPMLLLLALAESLFARNWTTLTKRLAACAAIFACAWILIWAFYGFRYAAAPNDQQPSPPLAAYIQSIPSHQDTHLLALAAHIHLLPEAYLWGLADTKHTEWEYTSYFFGHVYRHGPWQYFPAAFLIKSTLPLLLFLLLLPLLWFRANDRHARELCFLLLPIAVYIAVIAGSHFDIGARHLMPVYPFLYLLAAAGAANAFRRHRAWAAVAAILLTWQIVTSVRVAPAYMAYGNEAWGGPSQVHRYLSDANVDWGQQLKSVRQYLDKNHITNCWFAYFPDGAVQPSDYGVHCRRLPTANNISWMSLPMTVPPVISGTVLISDSDLEGIEFGDGSLNPYRTFQSLKPVAVIQHGVDVYQGTFAIPLASALIDVRTSGELLKAGQPQAALATATTAVTLAPGSAITQLNLADTLAAQQKWAEALPHYQIADTLVHTIRPDLQEEPLLPGIDAGLAATRKHLQP
jgi:tetratricopeptide (TPR) repeat protein